MATTTNYGWTTPNDTDLVKDGAAAIRTLGSSIDTTVFANAGAGIAKSIVDAKGDIIAATAADTVDRLAVGANDTVLTADSTTATGLKWATAAASTNYTLLNAGGTALTGASTITVSGISNQDKLLIIVTSASSTAASAGMSIRFNADSGNNYYQYGTQNVRTAASPNFALHVGAKPEFRFADVVNDGDSGFGAVSVFGAKSSGVKMVDVKGVPTATNAANSYNTLGYYDSSSTISSVSVVTSTGDFDNGTVYVYGSGN
jgi:hypothetical protein